MTPVENLRHLMAERQIQGVLVSMSDPFQNESPPPAFQRIRYLTHFTGSYGLCLVLGKKAALFVDGRYTTQAQQQIDTSVFDIQPYGWASVKSWLSTHYPKDLHISYDPWTFTYRDHMALNALATSLECTFLPSSINDVDAIRSNIDPIPATPLFNYQMSYAGETATSKIEKVCTSLKEHAIDHFIFFDPLSLCWLLNIRGNDTPCTPVSLCYGILDIQGTIHLFIDLHKIVPTVRDAIGVPIVLHPIEEFASAVQALGRSTSSRIGYDPDTALSVLSTWSEACPSSFVPTKDPSILLRACKNATEISQARQAHVYDALCLIRFFTWLDTHWTKELLTGYTLTQKLEACRAENPFYQSLSFPAIVGVNAQSAIIHYRAERTTAPVTDNSIILIDSGSQYLEGTTDITRMVFLGPTPSARQKEVYTLVLKGLIALSQARFPKGVRGCQLDTLARSFLWQQDLDYAHSTGHGVGQFLNVHEGPQNISTPLKDVPLEPGMIVSNEPGCYFPNEWGIRIENLMVVVDTGNVDLLSRPVYAFETLTLVPIAQNLMDVSLLTFSEITWLNEYHKRVYQIVSPHLDSEEHDWLKKATQAIDTIT